MSVSTAVDLGQLRSLAYTSISGTYAAIGTALTFPVRVICFTNNTDGDMFFSIDGMNNYLFLPAMSFKLFDVTTNRNSIAPSLCFATGTQFLVKESTVPTKGAVYVECLG